MFKDAAAFMSLIAETFVAPKAAEDAKKRFLDSRRIVPPKHD
jgi:hypothetical protein